MLQVSEFQFWRLGELKHHPLGDVVRGRGHPDPAWTVNPSCGIPQPHPPKQLDQPVAEEVPAEPVGQGQAVAAALPERRQEEANNCWHFHQKISLGETILC